MAKARATVFEARLLKDPYAIVRGPWLGKWLVVGDTFLGVRAIGRQVHMDGVTPGVVDRVIRDTHLRHYTPLDDMPLQSVITGLKEEMLAHGATPLAVQWMGDLAPFTTKELDIMAKLATQGAGKPKADKAAAKPKADKAAPKGNTAALEKAREARAGKTADFDKQKITINTEKKANPYREGTKAHATFELIKQHKTVGDVKAAANTDDHDIGYIRYASRDGHITLS